MACSSDCQVETSLIGAYTEIACRVASDGIKDHDVFFCALEGVDMTYLNFVLFNKTIFQGIYLSLVWSYDTNLTFQGFFGCLQNRLYQRYSQLSLGHIFH